MKMPTASSQATDLFETVVPRHPEVTRRPMFGQPAAYVRGNMFCGVFGEAIVVRLADADRAEALRTTGIAAFEPMAGRPMRGWVALSRKVLSDRPAVEKWVQLALGAGLARPAKPPGKATSSRAGPSARKPSRH
jgi:TfoX/Sxy family transcriptional regulator of competence genes